MNTHIDGKGDALNICGVVVAFYPDEKKIQALLDVLAQQVQLLYVADNSDMDCSPLSLVATIPLHYQFFGENRGVAAAHNAGIAFARTKGCTHVLLMDQDSLPHADMVHRLVQAERKLCGQGKKVAAVGPLCFHPQRHYYEPFLQCRAGRVTTLRCVPDQASLLPVAHLISSGSLISIHLLDSVGDMEESLFIDYIDIEWAFRASAKGYACYAVCGAVLEHYLGGVEKKGIGGMSRTFSSYGATRLYYQFRNLVSLAKRGYVPRTWLVYHVMRYMAPRFLAHTLFLPPRLQHLHMIIRGIMDGMRGKTGPLFQIRL